MAPGRAMTNAAVARAMGQQFHEVRYDPCSRDGVFICIKCNVMYCAPPWTQASVETERCDRKPVDDFLGNAALALRVLVPWLRERSAVVTLVTSQDGWMVEAVTAAKVHRANADTLAHACCQVVLAVANNKENA